MQRIFIHPYYFSWEKRVFDILVSGIILTSGLPILIGIALLVLLTEGWPVFFVQKRMGMNQKSFHVYKFRTMYIGADKDQKKYAKENEAPVPMFKLKEDPRFIGIGRLLSHSGLDELPQMWNLIKGEMSLIGPRALPMTEAKKLPKDWNFRYSVRPGILSEWAISPARFKSLNEWKKLEIQTLKNASLKKDISFILDYGLLILSHIRKLHIFN